MKLCAVSFKECWRDESGAWYSYGGFPRQMAAISSLFDETDLLIVEVSARSGGLPLPPVRIVPLRRPTGVDFRRKMAILANLPYYVTMIARHVRSADVVHVPLPGDIPLIALWVAVVLRKRIIGRYGGSWHPTAVTTMMNRVTRACLRLLARGENVMLAVGEEGGRPARGMHWIFSTALSKNELKDVRPALARGLSNPPHLVFIGRLSAEKGVAQVIKAVHRLSEDTNRPPVRLTIIGDGPDRQELEDLVARLGCRARIQFTGQLNRTDLSRQLLEADFSVQPSETESFCKAWLDAMAHGLPVLSSDVGASAHAALGENGERGWLVPPGDLDALTLRLGSILQEPIDWPAMRRRCRDFTESRTIEEWRDFIGGLCAQRWNCRFQDGRLSA